MWCDLHNAAVATAVIMQARACLCVPPSCGCPANLVRSRPALCRPFLSASSAAHPNKPPHPWPPSSTVRALQPHSSHTRPRRAQHRARHARAAGCLAAALRTALSRSRCHAATAAAHPAWGCGQPCTRTRHAAVCTRLRLHRGHFSHSSLAPSATQSLTACSSCRVAAATLDAASWGARPRLMRSLLSPSCGRVRKE